MSNFGSVIISTLLVIICLGRSSFARTSQYPYIPCPEVFQYMPSGNTNIGIITVKDVSYGKTTVSIELSQHGAMNTNNPGQLSLNFNKDDVFDFLNAGKPFTYRVDFPNSNYVPRVTSIRVNGQQICSGPGDSPPSTTMKLEYTINAFSSGSFSREQQSSALNMHRPNFNQQNYPSPQNLPSRQNFPNYQFFPSQTNPSFRQSYANQMNKPASQHLPGSQLNSDMPEFLKYSPTFAQQMLPSQPSNFPTSSFDPSSSFKPAYFNQHTTNNRTTLNKLQSFHSSSFFHDGSPEEYFNQQIPFNPTPSTRSSRFTKSPQNPSSFIRNSTSFESFLRPPFVPQSYNQNNFPSFAQTAVSNPHFNNKNNNQPESQFEANPRNPFFSKPNVIGLLGLTTPPPTQIKPVQQPTQKPAIDPRNVEVTPTQVTAPPLTTTSTPIKPVQQPTQKPAFDPRNVEVTPTQVTAPPPTTTTTTTTTSTTTTKTAVPKDINPASFEYINSICGRENANNIDMQKLNVKGQVISKSRFPWIVAVFQKNNKQYKFKCGGNLISTRTVVSAAHCFYNGFEIIKPEEIMVSMGRHNLTETLDSANIDAERIIQHPDYRPTLINFDADIAIVRLKQSVVFTVAIRPICMWQGAVDSRELEGVSGIIVGWGGDGRRNTTTVPTLVNATVVSEITCLRSNDVFISLTSNRTLCAGNLDGSGPCMGDSGNGLMIRNRNKWMLRGTVSAALGTADRPCMQDQYAIYSDIAMFVEWIRLNMLL